MRVFVNGPLLRRRARISGLYLLGATACLAGGFGLSLLQHDPGLQYAISIASLVLGLFLWSRNQAYLLRWGPRFRQDDALRRALRALDDRHHLLVAPAEGLPDYLLVGPMGVLVLAPSAVRGAVECARNRWRHTDARPLLIRLLLWFAPNPGLGNPTAEASRGVEATRHRLVNSLGNPLGAKTPVEAVAVFTSPQVTLRVEGCLPTALLLRSLRSHVRRLPRALSASEVEKVLEALTT